MFAFNIGPALLKLFQNLKFLISFTVVLHGVVLSVYFFNSSYLEGEMCPGAPCCYLDLKIQSKISEKSLNLKCP